MTSADLLNRVDREAVLDLASRLIEIEGHQSHPLADRRVAEYVAARLRERLPPERSEVFLQPVEADKRNVIAVLRGDRPGPTLMLNAHLDTVPDYGMGDAYRPTKGDGRLYGRGAVDMKGALAAMMICAELLSGADVSFAGKLVLTAVAGEESGSAGMLALARSGLHADFTVVGEPTLLRVARAHKGAMWIEAAFRGVATHGSVPQEGVNAIYHAARFTSLIETQLAPALSQRCHPLLGNATVSVGVIVGGDRPPMVPASCSVQLDRRWLPGENHDQVLGEIRALVDQLHRDDPAVDAVVREMDGTSSFVHSPLDCSPEEPGLQLLLDVAASRTGSPRAPVGVQFWTDGALFSASTGTPAVVCGPGDIAQAHSFEEWVSVEQLHQAAEVYLLFAARFLSAVTDWPGLTRSEAVDEKEQT